MKSLTEYRDVTITITNAPFGIDGYKAVNKQVEDLEKDYNDSLDETGTSSLVDLAGVTTVLTGTTPFKIYVFTLTTVFASGEYTFDYVETAPNVETAPSLNP